MPESSAITRRFDSDSFSFGLILIVLLILSWFTYDRYASILENQKKTSDYALAKARDSIAGSISTKKRLLDNFVLEHRQQIIHLIKDPRDQKNYDYLFEGLRRQLPDLFTINVFTPEGKIVIPDFEGFVGELCIRDLNLSLKEKIHRKRTHPNNVLYHYDEISQFNYAGKTYLFFASFSLGEIADTLLYSTPRDHNLLLIDRNNNYLIEITNSGGRDKLVHRKQLQLTEQEIGGIVSQLDIPGTYWLIVDIEEPAKRRQLLVSQAVPSLIIFFVVSLIIIIMKRDIDKTFSYLNTLNAELEERNLEITKLNAELENVAIKDALTDMFNRRYFTDQFETEWNRAIRNGDVISVLIVDIDYFKKFNDIYGHVEGDNCLRTVSEIISSCFLRSNEFVARYGGEEFIGVVNDDLPGCMKIADAIHARLESKRIPYPDSGAGYVTVSIGVASARPKVGEASIELVKQADAALYQAKENGRNQTRAYQDSDT